MAEEYFHFRPWMLAYCFILSGQLSLRIILIVENILGIANYYIIKHQICSAVCRKLSGLRSALRMVISEALSFLPL